jgi:hypothetical protein
MTNAPACPICGVPLTAIDTGTNRESPPWGCYENCLRGWFNAELTPEARDAWNPALQDWGELTPQIIAACYAEAAGQQGS